MRYAQWKVLLKQHRVIFGLTVLVFFTFCAVFADFLAPYTFRDADVAFSARPPDSRFLLGCDLSGLDVLSSMIFGARISLTIGFLTVLLSATVGVLVGLVSGYFGGFVDQIFMRLVDLLMAFPALLVAMLLAATLGQSPTTIIFAISATGWISTARLVRGEVLKYKELSYIRASRALGAGHVRLMVKHIFPATVTALVVQATFSLSGVIIIESSLSFLGLGTQEGYPSWGGLLAQGQQVIGDAPHLSIAPGIAIMLVVMALNFLGDGLRDVLDPKSRI